MPLWRYRNLDQADRALNHHGRDLAERIAYVWSFGAALVEIPPPRGLRKFRNVEEANADQLAFTRARARALEERRRMPSALNPEAAAPGTP